MEHFIKAIIKQPNQSIQIVDLHNTLETYQAYVGGYLECVSLPSLGGANLIINEEGKLDNLEPNVMIPEYHDVIVGTIIAVGAIDSYGDVTSLTDAQISLVLNYFAKYGF